MLERASPLVPRSRVAVLRRILLGKAAVGCVLAAGLGAGTWLRAHGLTAVDFAHELRRTDPRFTWRSVDKRHWQALVPGGGPGEATEVTDAREQTGAGCAGGMVRVKGDYRLESFGDGTGEIERLQDAACTDWISRDFPARCRTFDREKIAAEVAKLPTKAVDFCIDRFEYPNVAGENPMIVATFREAEATCKASRKRLCTESEWTFACEGEEVQPYPYGFERDGTACVMDRSWRPFKEGALQPRDGVEAREELDRLWQGEPSGSRSACRSAFGVYDMTGNVDEWTRSVRKTGYSSVLKGGYWGPVRARCRPATRAHNEDFVAYQQGFRCCAESDHDVPAPRPVVARAAVGSGEALVVAPPARPAADRPREADEQLWLREEQADEIDALTRARTSLGCAAAAPRGGTGEAVAAAGALAALVASRRRRRARCASCSPPAPKAGEGPPGRGAAPSSSRGR